MEAKMYAFLRKVVLAEDLYGLKTEALDLLLAGNMDADMKTIKMVFSSMTMKLSNKDWESIRNSVMDQRKIDAIKILRQISCDRGCSLGLKEAKDYIDNADNWK